MRTTTLLLASALLSLAGCASHPDPQPQAQAEPATNVVTVPVYVVPNCTAVPGRCFWIQPRVEQHVTAPQQQPKRVQGIAL